MVASRSASSQMMAADLPPSSRVQRLSCSPQMAPILRPAAVDPVNDTLSMSGWRTRCSPTSRSAATMLTTPAGRPDDSRISASTLASSGVSGAGLSTMVEPEASAGASLQHHDEQRHVPRDDAGGHAHRLLAHEDRSDHAVAGLLELELAGQAGEEVEHGGGGEDLAHDREVVRGAVLARDEAGEVVHLGRDRGRDRRHDVGPLGGAMRGHGPRSKASRAAATARSMSALVDTGHAADDLFGGRRHDVEGVACPSGSTHLPPMKNES